MHTGAMCLQLKMLETAPSFLYGLRGLRAGLARRKRRMPQNFRIHFGFLTYVWSV